ncbi:pyridoxamine 5'-phosphate oxidase [Kribbella sp. NPDC050281]|uniref:pyridoxamine 5'-phosphate oxidase n=1 Tax=Kribbella sp. NPDC050281 TaxID=3155515 RepID=UPI0033F14A41
MAIMNRQQREEFLAGQHIGAVSVGRTDGRPPTTVPTFYAYEPGGALTMFTATQGRTPARIDAIKAAGVITFLVQEETWPTKYVTVEATLDSVTRPTVDQMLTILRRYMPEEAAQQFAHSEVDNPGSTITLFTFTPSRWFSADNSA